MLNFTGGKWETTQLGFGIIVNGEKGEKIVADCTHIIEPITGENREEALANALLISQAPAMYEAIKELLRRDSFGSIRLPTQASDLLKQSVAKLEGEK